MIRYGHPKGGPGERSLYTKSFTTRIHKWQNSVIDSTQHNRSRETLSRVIDASKITHESNYLTERKKIIEELQRHDAAYHPDLKELYPLSNKPKVKVKKLPRVEGDGMPEKSSKGSHREPTEESKRLLLITEPDQKPLVKLIVPTNKRQRQAEPIDDGSNPKRVRDFRLKVYTRKNMFEGFSFFQYDQYAIADPTLQRVILRDQLLILIDKTTMLKNEIYDDNLTKKVKRNVPNQDLRLMNRRIEEILSILNELVKLLLFGTCQ